MCVFMLVIVRRRCVAGRHMMRRNFRRIRGIDPRYFSSGGSRQ
jgi:hypothetical protein